MFLLKPPGRTRDQGAGFVEYTAVIALVGIILLAIITSRVASQVSNGIQAAIDQALNGQSSDEQTTPPPNEGTTDSGGEETALGGGGSNEEGSGNTAAPPMGQPLVIPEGEHGVEYFEADMNDPAYWHPAGAENATPAFFWPWEVPGRAETRGRSDVPPLMRGDESDGIDGDPNGGNGLGEPVEGNSAEEPEMPPWEPYDLNHGEWNSTRTTDAGRSQKRFTELAARAALYVYPHASRNLLYYLSNLGEPLEQDVDSMLEEMPEFDNMASSIEDQLIAEAVAEARSSGSTGPVTFPVSTDWIEYKHQDIGSKDDNWFNAVGDFEWGVSGTITVSPPSNPGEDWTYSSSTRIHMRDHYNWDGNKATAFGPVVVKDRDMRELHFQGIAKEFPMFGASGYRANEGEY